MHDGYQALITDLDGTAVRISSDGSDVTNNTRQAVQSAQQRGFRIACASGRPWELAEPVLRALGITSPCIVEGGARIVDVETEKTLWEKSLDTSVLQTMLDVFKRESSAGRVYTAQLSPAELHTITDVPAGSRFIYLLDLDPDTAARVESAVNAYESAAAHVTPSWSGRSRLDVHVTHPEATKQHAVRAWQEMHGTSVEQTIGMGDSRNDIPLLRSTGMKIAVNDADPELKRMADYIVPEDEENVLSHSIKRFLIQE